MPLVPFRPTTDMMRLARMRVISVIPLTGLLPTMAMAFAATVVKRKEMTKTMASATHEKRRLPPMTSSWKKRKVARSDTTSPMTMTFMEMSRCVRGHSSSPCASCFLPKAARMREKLPRMTERLFHTPMMPAMAMPPMPMLLAYWKISCGEAVAAAMPSFTSSSGQMRAMTGTAIHQMSTEPAHMMAAYFRPMM